MQPVGKSTRYREMNGSLTEEEAFEKAIAASKPVSEKISHENSQELHSSTNDPALKLAIRESLQAAQLEKSVQESMKKLETKVTQQSLFDAREARFTKAIIFITDFLQAAASMDISMPEAEFIRKWRETFPEITKYKGVFFGLGGSSAQVGDNERYKVEESLRCFYYLMKGDYENFTQFYKGTPLQLTPNQFAELAIEFSSFCNGPSPDETTVPAVILLAVLFSLHDLGKSIELQELVKKKSGLETIDHDKVSVEGLKLSKTDLAVAEWFPTFASLPVSGQQYIIKILSFDFNVMQLIQGEAPAYVVEHLKELRSDEFGIKLLKLFLWLDLVGNAGINPKVKRENGAIVKDSHDEPVLLDNKHGSVVLTRHVQDYFKASWKAVLDRNEKNPYQKYLAIRKEMAGVDKSTPDFIARAACALRSDTKEEWSMVQEAFSILPEQIKGRLAKELEVTGFESKAIMQYYMPDALMAARATVPATADKATKTMAIAKGLYVCGLIFEKVRAKLDEQGASREKGICSCLVLDVANALKDPNNGPFKASFIEILSKEAASEKGFKQLETLLNYSFEFQYGKKNEVFVKRKS